MADEKDLIEQERQSILMETAKINWQELQHFFAAGKLIAIDPSLDLVDVALQMSLDNAALVQQWQADQLLQPVSDEQAQSWHQNNATLWAVVIKPWVLVQDKAE